MSEEFTTTELAMIALVLEQNRDEYDSESQHLISDTADKARSKLNEKQ